MKMTNYIYIYIYTKYIISGHVYVEKYHNFFKIIYGM